MINIQDVNLTTNKLPPNLNKSKMESPALFTKNALIIVVGYDWELSASHIHLQLLFFINV